MKLAELTIGQEATISSLQQLDGSTRKKLMVMGILPNTPVTLVRKAPMGDPLQVRVRDVSVAIRKSTAEQISVEVA
ncbi:ferrous iron transport protein A [Vibrio breoganii]|uniref:Ferrous iron transport protein A n=2 Tax=Vibrio TaxID=662 RepID=A0AAJ5JMK2_9VIBR|nr:MULTISPECIES: FeoA family protein [Vibrio]ANO33373.1 iron transporter FeoA [Vibrio breoganii]MDN3716235.1 FeoA family protein [Vibrio breoganii]NMO75186.1 ferrous iron transport protein A [Vibrio breoganii]NMR71702.1 ferrous iron transport protein A [Vibrio breoganii]OCH75122.1 iron transporter FeoA [Vibrio breoganii]